ncbi:hypothetical protein ETB97_006730 [Aspergillus alliaceus]|uniref:Uncharacterized protein n=1 Tax=Petromyces alliaceus TaxID=209559 RepID=A0A5N6GCW6_PETAA|nr:uncharacterized protein BDW43DRAFT_305327 [Aspergillus alliaceus]KAB8239555.1 hypothetical protein BDW43DRAFT_305327 [Aspergillus alliaceus]KAE8392466.1 hypothetical protein BDV23DRAFT_55626 [Aspergillus alliaceus]KAF5856770.1 hypothetical protein ETB97_006730 [Aspergillus burnettii]
MGIPTGGVIAIVIVACLAAVSLGAAITKHFYNEGSDNRYQFSREQELYMRSVRMKNFGIHRQEARTKDKDLESAVYTEDGSSRF